MRHVPLLLALLLVAQTHAGGVLSPDAACISVKNAVERLYRLPDSTVRGFRCDFATGWDPALYVIDLRSDRHCPLVKGGICSTLVGWLAVRKSNGEVGWFDLDKGTQSALVLRKIRSLESR